MGRKIGCARFPIEDQHLELQLDALKAAGVEAANPIIVKKQYN